MLCNIWGDGGCCVIFAEIVGIVYFLWRSWVSCVCGDDGS